MLVSAIEHASVLSGGRFPREAIGSIGVTRSGVLDLDRLRAMLDGGPPALVSVMLANNETGALQPIPEAAALVHAAGGLLHVDAIQAFGKIPFTVDALGADLVTLSAHKIGGPKGVGAVVLAEGLLGLEPLCAAAVRNWAAGPGPRMSLASSASAPRPGPRWRLSKPTPAGSKVCGTGSRGACGKPWAHRVRRRGPRLPNTTLFTVPGLGAETAVIGFDLAGIAVSSGSACSSGKVQPSHVLAAMGFGGELAQGAIRLSLGWSTSEADIDRCLEAWRKLQGTLLKGSDETLLERF